MGLRRSAYRISIAIYRTDIEGSIDNNQNKTVSCVINVMKLGSNARRRLDN